MDIETGTDQKQTTKPPQLRGINQKSRITQRQYFKAVLPYVERLLLCSGHHFIPNIFPILFLRPCFVVGTPVAFAISCLIFVTPVALLRLNVNPGIPPFFFAIVYHLDSVPLRLLYFRSSSTYPDVTTPAGRATIAIPINEDNMEMALPAIVMG